MNTNNKYKIAVFEGNENADLIEYSEKMKDSIEKALDDNKGEKGEQGIQGEQGVQGEQGIQGIQGPRGKDFSIYKTYSSIEEMNNDAENVEEGNFVMIASDVEDEDNAKLFVKSSTKFNYLTDLSGATGMKGEQGVQGIQGPQGLRGEKGEKGDNGEIIGLSNTYKGSNISGQTCEGFGKIHKLYGKTEETGEGEKSPSNPHEISCVADNINLFDKDKLQIASAWQATYSLDTNKNLTVNSTATSGVAFVKTNALSLKADTYTFSADITGAFQEVRVIKSDGTRIKTISTKTDSFTVAEDTQIYFEFYVWATSTSNTMTIKNIQIEEGTEATEYREYGEGSIKITSTDGTNTSNKVISCKPLCCLKDAENNIIAQDYIDFDRQKIVRQCNRVNLNDLSIYYSTVLGDYFDVQFITENYKGGFIKCNCLKTNMDSSNAWEAQEESVSFGSSGGVCLNIKILKSRLSSHDITGFKNWLASNNIIVVYQLSEAIEEDINVTSSIVQYQNATTISNLDNTEMEIELTNNKAISSINKSISELQEKNISLQKDIEEIKAKLNATS